MKFVLLGDPVEHSLSPVIHRAALDATGISGSYEARRVDPFELVAAMAKIREGGLDGANVTMPHKRLAAAECDGLDQDATAAGVVNTVAVSEGKIRGWNTDVGAIRDALAAMPQGPVLVLGAGGAAAAALLAAGDRESTVAARRIDAARAFGSSVVEWGWPEEGAIVINATPLGMAGESLPEGMLAAAAGLIDLAYGPSETPAVAAMRRRGLPVVDGLELLVAQAAASFTIWTGVAAPLEAMRKAVGR